MTNYKNIKKLGLSIIAFDDTCHLYNIISELRHSVDYVSIGVLKVSYHGDPISTEDLNEIIRLQEEDHIVDNIVYINLDLSLPARVQETEKRNILILDAQDHGCTHCICIDSDEYYTRKSFESACQKIDDNDYPITYCQYINYYHDYNHFLVYPFKDGMHVPFVTRVEYRHNFECTDFPLPSDPTRRFVRPYSGILKIKTGDNKYKEVKQYTVDYYVFPWNEIKMHHLSWLRTNIRKKLNVWSSKKCFDNYNDLIDKSVYSYENFDENKETNDVLMLFNTPGNKVEVKKFPKQYIHPKVDFKTRIRKTPNYKRIVVLSMSADTPLFNALETVSNNTWRNIDKTKFKHCDNIEFWTYTDTDKETYVDLDNHIIYIKKEPLLDIMGEDGGICRTFSKTIFALQELNKHTQYDYIIRTNNSTWLNIPLLNLFLSYVDDDSLIFGGTIYSCFWSAFNLYCGGNLMIFAKRTIDILLNIAKDPVAIENQLIGADDNIIFGLLNSRLVKLELPQSIYYHSIGEFKIKDKVMPVDCNFNYPAIQIKTFDLSDDIRLEYDPEKMYRILEIFNERNITDDDLEDYYNNIIESKYDISITILPLTKLEYFDLDKKIPAHSYLPVPRGDDAFNQIHKLQQKGGYRQTLI